MRDEDERHPQHGLRARLHEARNGQPHRHADQRRARQRDGFEPGGGEPRAPETRAARAAGFEDVLARAAKPRGPRRRGTHQGERGLFARRGLRLDVRRFPHALSFLDRDKILLRPGRLCGGRGALAVHARHFHDHLPGGERRRVHDERGRLGHEKEQQPLGRRDQRVQEVFREQVGVGADAADFFPCEDRALFDDLLRAVAAPEPQHRHEAQEQPQHVVLRDPADEQRDEHRLRQKVEHREAVGRRDVAQASELRREGFPVAEQPPGTIPAGLRRGFRRGCRRVFGMPVPPRAPFFETFLDLSGRLLAAVELDVNHVERFDAEKLARLLGRAVEHEPAAVDEKQPVEKVGAAQHVRRADDRAVGGGQMPQQPHEVVFGRRVEAGRRLVEEKRGRLGEKFGGDAHALALAAGKPVNALGAVLLEPEAPDDFVHERPDFRLRDAGVEPQPCAVQDGLLDCQLDMHDVVLRHVADPSLARRRL